MGIQVGDSQGDLVRYVNPMGEQFSYEYDENHRMTSMTDPKGNGVKADSYPG